ncbi:MAG: CDC27 family protein [Pseudomonadales bacterium]|nr:CDC27 family protein [Pseudomonadales bacterium]
MEKYLGNYIKPLVFALAVTTASTGTWAADDSELSSLRQEMAFKQTAAAWTRAQKMRPQWEANPEFDYLYGLLAYDQGKYNEAQFALERVVLAEPSNARARLALAKSYYKLGDEHSALRQFNAVKVSDPPAYILREVNHYMAQMGQGRIGTFNGFVEAGVGHDSNVNSANSANTIANPAFDPLDVTSDPYVILGAKGRRSSDMYDYVQGGLDYYKPLSIDTSLELRGRYSARNNFSSSRYDNNIYNGSASIVKLVGRDQFRATFTAQDYRLSDSDYQNYFSLSGDWTHFNYGGWSVSTALFINRLKYPDDSLRDVNQYIGSAALQYQQGAIAQSFGLMVGDENARRSDGGHNARNFTGLFYNISYDVAINQQLFARAYLQDSHSHGEDPYFHQRQDSTFQQLTLGWNWQLSKPLRLRTELVYSTDDSDIDYYSYDRTRLQTGLRYSF